MIAKTLAAGALALLVAGCSSDVKLISADDIAAFKPGSTSQAEIAAALGKPTHSITEAGGEKIDQYPFEGSASGGSGLPLIGNSGPRHYGMVSFVYSPGGILKSVDTGK